MSWQVNEFYGDTVIYILLSEAKVVTITYLNDKNTICNYAKRKRIKKAKLRLQPTQPR